MSLTTSAMKYPVSVAVGVILAAIGGLAAVMLVPVQLTPTVQQPVITVTTVWPGAAPEEIEKDVVQKQEKYLKSIEGLLEMTSESQDGYGQVSLEFGFGTDLTEALVKTTNKLNEVPSYPENVEQPIVSTSSPFDRAIAWFVLTRTGSDTTLYVPHMQRLIEDVIQPRFERVEGVSAINPFGGLEQELHVVFDPDVLASMQITVPELRASLQGENRDISAGDFGEGKRRYVVRTTSRFATPEDVENAIVTTRNGVPIHVRDIADVDVTYEKAQAMVRHKGVPSIAFNAQLQLGANSLKVIDGLMEQMELVNREVLEPRGLKVLNVYRESVYIQDAITRVRDNLFLGAALTVLALFLFLRSWTSILIIGVSIPVSVVTGFFVMFLFGRTVNVVSLAGMAFAVGMVVDSAIVVLENIYRHMQMGKSRWEATRDATGEVWGAVLASTLTTVAVFLPIIFVQERAATLFRDIAIAISAAIAMSMLVAITLIPTMSSRLLRASQDFTDEQDRHHRLARFARFLSHVVDRVNARPLRRAVVTLGIVGAALSLTFLLLPPSEYLPNGNQNFVFGFMLPPPGYNLDEVIAIGQSIENQMRPLWEADEAAAAEMPGGGIDNFFFVAFSGQAFMGMSSRDRARASELVPVANGALFSVPGAIGFANQASLFARGLAGTRSVRIDITGPDIEHVLGIAMRVFGQVGEVVPGSNSRPIPGLDLGNPEVRVKPNRTRAADVGFTATDIGVSVNSIVDGMKVSEYFHEGREIDLLIKGRDSLSRHTQDIGFLPLATPVGRVVTVGDVADVSLRQGPLQINHIERQRAVSIETVLPEGIALEEAIRRVQDEIVTPLRAEGTVGGLYDIKMAGTADDLSRLRSALRLNFFAVVVLTYLLLAALFQSFLYPLVIMTTVPLATFGGVLGLRLVMLLDDSQQLDILTMLGFVILVGTVVNNSILIVHQALSKMRDEGWDARQAVRESVRIRVRPIFMTTWTSVCGMLPLIVMPGAGAELYRGLGSVVAGGLLLSTTITLMVTPLVFSYAIELREKVVSLVTRAPAARPEPASK